MSKQIFNGVFQNKTVLVTGHTGFIGSWLTLWLKQLDANVIGYSLKPPTEPSLFDILDIKKGITNVISDLRDKEKLSSIINEYKPEIVFHLAAQPLVRESYEKPVETFEVNVIGTANLLQAIRNSSVKSAVIMTSDKCYNNRIENKMHIETDPMGGSDPYSASKGAAELVTSSFRDSYFDKENNRVEISTVRAGNILGGGDWAKDRIIPDCIRSWSSGNPAQLRNPNATRPWQHVLEAVGGYISLAINLMQNKNLHGESFNFGPSLSKEYSVLELVKAMSKNWENVSWKLVSKKKKNFFESGLLRLNCNKAKKILKWKSVLKFEENVEFVADWYRNYYLNYKNINYFTERQIKKYQLLAYKRGFKWAKPF